MMEDEGEEESMEEKEAGVYGSSARGALLVSTRTCHEIIKYHLVIFTFSV